MTNIPRLYVESDLVAGQATALAEPQAHYLSRVMRLQTEDTARLFNGRDGEWSAALEVQGKRVSATPTSQTRAQPEPPTTAPKLLFAPLKKARTDFAVEKATELGASRIQPITTRYTQTHRVRVDRLAATALEAAEQTERMDVPEVRDVCTLEQALGAWDAAEPLLFCDEAGDAAPIAVALEKLKPETSGGILIGPEGGFSSGEREMLRDYAFIVPVTLGPRILRAETAIASALTIWQAVVGDWKQSS